MVKNTNINLEVIAEEIKRYIDTPLNTNNMDNYIELIKKCDELEVLIQNDLYKNTFYANILKFKSKLNIFLENLIKNLPDDNNIDKLTSIILDAIQIDIKNIKFIENITHIFIDNELFLECIELYKAMFVITENPIYFEKIGDIYIIKKDYENAIDAYLSCVEISDKNVEAYKKLAKIFEQMNDFISRNACLNQIKIIEEESAK